MIKPKTCASGKHALTVAAKLLRVSDSTLNWRSPLCDQGNSNNYSPDHVEGDWLGKT